ncbi:metallophosphatase family protein [Deinococcus taeanensis]|uniref:metallophosphoesterase family protein n=1 Tax=Deinococcus taeanensis TaxID=2737050 RepID=UPI001CDB5A5A|nr:metallophosphoesterase family protein [Deinococcus taeanensis]UBV42200.1 metallophosphatase family protein [Deinococcus taeanensis]
MRIAVLGDVHGNAFALEAVLADLRACAPDLTLNLGDTVWGAADPARAWALQLEHAPPTVRGNTDELVAGWHPDRFPEWQAWVTEQLPPDLPGTLGALPTTAQRAGGELLLAHGAPHTTWDALFAGPDGRSASPAELEARVQDFPAARVVLIGHTHQEQLRSVHGLTFVNVGAVSRQLQGDPAARWTLLERRAGQWNVTFRRVPYNVEAAAAWAAAHCPMGAQEAEHLRTGRPPG